jgi:hypothetical protein
MNTIIRKISVGKEYPNGCIHYQLGSVVNLKGNKYKVSHILMDREAMALGKLIYNIYISNIPEYDNQPVSELLWKSIADVPVVVENNIDFD